MAHISKFRKEMEKGYNSYCITNSVFSCRLVTLHVNTCCSLFSHCPSPLLGPALCSHSPPPCTGMYRHKGNVHIGTGPLWFPTSYMPVFVVNGFATASYSDIVNGHRQSIVGGQNGDLVLDFFHLNALRVHTSHT